MRIINLGSLNIDKVYRVPHFVRAGETLSSTGYEVFCGGKGLNQSVALARAGAKVYHAGAIGDDGEMLADQLRQAGVDIRHLQTLKGPSGHAVIQLNPDGQNCIIVEPGANGRITTAYIDSLLQAFSPGDCLLLQNETAHVAYAIERAHEAGLTVAFNPSPIDEALFRCPLHLVDHFLLNEVEGAAISGIASDDFEAILGALEEKFPTAAVVLTAGRQGVYYARGGERIHHSIYNVPVVDTTAAGDTFCGYYLASLSRGHTLAETLEYASRASSIAVSKPGAAESIPTWEEMRASLLS